MNNENLLKILSFLGRIEKLKTIKRAISVSDNSRKESSADHTWRTAVMAMILTRELGSDINLLKTLKMVLIHDIVEVVAGDAFILDEKSEEEKLQKEKELNASKELYSMLPDEIGSELENLWLEYENGLSKESRFARALDKIEVIIQRTNLRVENWERRDIDDILVHWADKRVNDTPELAHFWKLVQNEMRRQLAT